VQSHLYERIGGAVIVMPWLPLALLTALLAAASDALTKAFLRPLGTFKMAAGRVLGPIPFLFPLLLFQHWPSLDKVFWEALSALLPLETAALILYMEAIRVSPLSLTVPFLSFSPAFMILTGAAILGERLSVQGILGIFFIVIGSYMLHIKSVGAGWFAPISAIIRERGSILMLGVAFLYAITSVLGKLAIRHSSPLFFASFYFVAHGVFAGLFLAIFFRIRPWVLVYECPKGIFWVGLSQAMMVIFHMWAISLAPAAYMIAVKRLSVLFGVVFGYLFFKERDLASRLFGATLMAGGVFIIAFS